MAETLKVIILTPNQVILQAEARSVSSRSSLGPFDILPRHANLIALIQNQPITITLADGKKVEYKFPMAIVYNTKSMVKVYTDILAQPNIKIT